MRTTEEAQRRLGHPRLGPIIQALAPGLDSGQLRAQTHDPVMDDIREHPYADFLRSVTKPSRYLGGEQGEIRKDWDGASCRMCLAFSDVYEVGMSHLGYRILYSGINGQEGLLAERAYAPWADMEKELRDRSEPLRSLETWRPLSDFDVVGFSLQFELTFTNILLMLDLGGIPLRSVDRDEDHPLILAGGPTATHPEPVAPFIDALLIGDGEQKVIDVMRCWSELKAQGVPRAERLAALAALGGLYVPSLYDLSPDPESGLHVVTPKPDSNAPFPVVRTMVDNINDYPFPKDGPIASTETVFDRVSVELSRGCTEGCRFCQAGMIYRPVRERDPAQVLDVVEHSIKNLGYDSTSLTSLSTADYSAISPLIHKVTDVLKEQRASLSVSSLRAYGMAEDVMDALKSTGTKGLTFAPEAGTQRMRDVINKNVTEEQLLETAERVFSRGWDRMKLYFILGLPTEEDEDVLGIVKTGARALGVGYGKMGKRAKVVVNVSTHVPKPHTPFQWCAMDAHTEVQRKQRMLRDEARRRGVTLKLHDSVGSWIEGVIARGDQRIANVIEIAYKNGARFDSWDELLNLDAWDKGFREAAIDPSEYLGTLPLTARLPWDHIDVGLEKNFLQKEYRKALRNRLSPPCGKAVGAFIHHTNLEDHEADARKLVCYNCGVACDMQAMHQERSDFLIQLGAKKPRDQVVEPTPDVTTPAPVKKKGGRKRPPERPDQGTPTRIRLTFTKVGRAAFCSHLDLVRLLPRLFRRLEMPLYYSLGFNSKPVLVFGPALSLGIAGLCEYVDVKLAQSKPIDLATLPARLSEASIDGIRFVAAQELQAGDDKLGGIIENAVYAAGIPRHLLNELGYADEAALQAKLDARMSEPLSVRRTIKGIGKNVDVSRYLKRATVGLGREDLTAGGFAGDLVPIEIELAITGAGTAKVSEALSALLEIPAEELPVRYARVSMSCIRGADEKLYPLDLDRLRHHKAIAREAREADKTREAAETEAEAQTTAAEARSTDAMAHITTPTPTEPAGHTIVLPSQSSVAIVSK